MALMLDTVTAIDDEMVRKVGLIPNEKYNVTDLYETNPDGPFENPLDMVEYVFIGNGNERGYGTGWFKEFQE